MNRIKGRRRTGVRFLEKVLVTWAVKVRNHIHYKKFSFSWSLRGFSENLLLPRHDSFRWVHLFYFMYMIMKFRSFADLRSNVWFHLWWLCLWFKHEELFPDQLKGATLTWLWKPADISTITTQEWDTSLGFQVKLLNKELIKTQSNPTMHY